MIKEYELYLPYFKQGSDLNTAMEQTEDDADAFLIHANRLEQAVKMLKVLAGRAKENGLRIENASTHYISVICDETVGDVLVNDGILMNVSNDDDFDDEETVDEEIE